MKKILLPLLIVLLFFSCSNNYYLKRTFPGKHLPTTELLSNTIVIIEMETTSDVMLMKPNDMNYAEQRDFKVRQAVAKSMDSNYVFLTKEQLKFYEEEKYRFILESRGKTVPRLFGHGEVRDVGYVTYTMRDRITNDLYESYAYPETDNLKYLKIHLKKIALTMAGMNTEIVNKKK